MALQFYSSFFLSIIQSIIHSQFWLSRIESLCTYIVLGPHDIEECEEGEVIVRSGEAGDGAENAPSQEEP